MLRSPLQLFCLLAAVAGAAQANSVKGSIELSGTRIEPRHVYLVKGPDSFEPQRIERRLIFSVDDIGGALAKCATMACTESALTQGMTLDLDGMPLEYWIVTPKKQHSGPAKPAALTATADEAKRVAGRFRVEGNASGVPAIDLEFDATLLKELAKAR